MKRVPSGRVNPPNCVCVRNNPSNVNKSLFYFKTRKVSSLKFWSGPSHPFHALSYVHWMKLLVLDLIFPSDLSYYFVSIDVFVVPQNCRNITFLFPGASDVSAEDEQEFCYRRYVVFMVTMEPLYEVLRGRSSYADQRLSKWRKRVSTSLRFGVITTVSVKNTFTLHTQLLCFCHISLLPL